MAAKLMPWSPFASALEKQHGHYADLVAWENWMDGELNGKGWWDELDTLAKLELYALMYDILENQL